VAEALKWIGKAMPAKPANANQAAAAFTTPLQGGSIQAPFYGFYGIERAGRLTGRRFIGGHDWYRVGCQCLVNSQQTDGSWKAATLDGQPIIATSFALLFLAKAGFRC